MEFSFYLASIIIFLICLLMVFKPSKNISLFGGASICLLLIYMAAPFIFILIAATISLLRGIYIEIYDPQKRIEINGR